MNIPQSIKDIVATAPLAHLTTLNPDGSPQTTVVWVLVRDEEFLLAHMGKWQKVKNVERDGRVTLSFLGPGKNEMGLVEYVVVNGEAYITEGGAAALLQELADAYLGPGTEFPPEPYRNNPGYITHIRPTKFGGVGPWNEIQQ